jgi:hypothetical protein
MWCRQTTDDNIILRMRLASWTIEATNTPSVYVELVRNLVAHAQKSDFVFRRNGRVHLNRWGRHFSRLPAADVCASAVVMLDTPCSAVVWRVLATHSIRQFPLHFPSRPSPCVITFQLDSTSYWFSKAIIVTRTRVAVTWYLHCLSCYNSSWIHTVEYLLMCNCVQISEIVDSR